jgi:hypothetical protein
MLLVLVAWLLMLLTLAIWLRALHGMPIYTHTPLQGDSQRLQLRTLVRITQLLLSLALGLLALHFTLPQETQEHAPPPASLHTNTSRHSQKAADVMPAHNWSGAL